MLVQLICRSDRPTLKESFEVPFTFGEAEEFIPPAIILVPDLDSYNYVRGQLVIEGLEAEVICIPPPSEYKPPVGKVPYAFVTESHTPHCDPWGNGLVYYFSKL